MTFRKYSSQELAFEALEKRSCDLLCALPERRLQPDTSEIKGWITLAGACADLDYRLVGRTPGYRSPAGTGHADGFGLWMTG